MTVDHGGQMPPAVLPTRNMRHIHHPPFITPTGLTHPATHAGARGDDALMHTPPLLLQHSIHRFAIDRNVIPESQLYPETPIPERGMHLTPVAQALQPLRISRTSASRSHSHSMYTGPVHAQPPTTAPFRDTRHDRSYASDVFRPKG